MYLLEEIKKIIQNNSERTAIFVDMDGVVADYRFGEGDNIKNNKPGLYLNKRPTQNMSFIKKENKIFILSENFESRKKLKIDKIKEKLDSNECELAILIDDTQDILFLALSELKEKVIPFHVISLID